MKVNTSSGDVTASAAGQHHLLNHPASHFQTSATDSAALATASFLQGLSNQLMSKHIIKSFDSRGTGGAGGSSSSNHVKSFARSGGAATGKSNKQAASSEAGQGPGHKRYKSSAGSSLCHSSFSNERSKYAYLNLINHLEKQVVFDGGAPSVNMYASCDNRSGGIGTGGSGSGKSGNVLSSGASMLAELQAAYFN